MMFAAPLSTAAFIAGLTMMTTVFALKVGDPTMAYIAACQLSLNLIRVALVARTSPKAGGSVHLPSLLVIGCVFSMLMAALVLRAFALGNVEAIALAVIVAAGYLSGVLIRASVVPRLAIPHILTMFVPLIIASVLAADGRYWPAAFLLTCFCVGCIDLSRIIYGQIAAQLLAEHDLSLAAMTDSLTGLANRHALDGALAKRSASSGPTIVAMIDLDGFKMVNDSHGHSVGDELLKAVAKRMLGSLGGQHLASRIGGDEFAVLFEAGTTTINAYQICGAMVCVVGSTFRIGSVECRIGASVGLASSSDGTDIDSVKERADKALYVAKRQGRGQVVWSTASPAVVPALAFADIAADSASNDQAALREAGGCRS